MDTITIPVKEYKRLLRVDKVGRVESSKKRQGFDDAAFGALKEQEPEILHTRRARAFSLSFIGSGRSRGKGSGEIAERHDEALAGAFHA